MAVSSQALQSKRRLLCAHHLNGGSDTPTWVSVRLVSDVPTAEGRSPGQVFKHKSRNSLWL